MPSVLIVTHGRLAAELLSAGRTIAGEAEDCEAVCLGWQDSVEEIDQQISRSVDNALERSGEVLLLTDIFGSTPTNAAMKLRQPGRVEVVAGVNLPMVVRLSCAQPRKMPVTEMANWIESKGRSSICSCCAGQPTATSGESCDG